MYRPGPWPIIPEESMFSKDLVFTSETQLGGFSLTALDLPIEELKTTPEMNSKM